MGRVTSKGQVTIPAEIRQQFGFFPDTEVEFVVDGDTVRLRRVENGDSGRGERLVRRLRGRGTIRMTTDEIMALTRGS
jgi:AbrB family looped-hinge helix DNA binding protein